MNGQMRLLTIASLGVLPAVAACSAPAPAAPVVLAQPEPAAITPMPESSAAPSASAAPSEPRPIGPYEIPFDGKRTVYFAVPPSTDGPHRLIANLHGLCNPPGYACGFWTHAGSEAGFLVCPTGNSSCGTGADAPPTWTEGDVDIDRDLERAVTTVDAQYPGEMSRDGAVLTGFSRGAYAAGRIAVLHPGRWPYLLLTEADVPLDARTLRGAGVRAVAMLAGETGSQIQGERRTVQRLSSQGLRARLWVMPRAGHFYSANIDDIMREALDWLVRSPEGSDDTR
jgi:hypothetical protein